jgi:hypothetical protein
MLQILLSAPGTIQASFIHATALLNSDIMVCDILYRIVQKDSTFSYCMNSTYQITGIELYLPHDSFLRHHFMRYVKLIENGTIEMGSFIRVWLTRDHSDSTVEESEPGDQYYLSDSGNLVLVLPTFSYCANDFLIDLP